MILDWFWLVRRLIKKINSDFISVSFEPKNLQSRNHLWRLVDISGGLRVVWAPLIKTPKTFLTECMLR